MDLFAVDGTTRFRDEGSNEPELSDALKKTAFTRALAHGFDGEGAPRGFISVDGGMASVAGAYHGQVCNGESCAGEDNRQHGMGRLPGMLGPGVAHTALALKFKPGDDSARVEGLRLAGPFIKNLALMGRV